MIEIFIKLHLFIRPHFQRHDVPILLQQRGQEIPNPRRNGLARVHLERSQAAAGAADAAVLPEDLDCHVLGLQDDSVVQLEGLDNVSGAVPQQCGRGQVFDADKVRPEPDDLGALGHLLSAIQRHGVGGRFGSRAVVAVGEEYTWHNVFDSHHVNVDGRVSIGLSVRSDGPHDLVEAHFARLLGVVGRGQTVLYIEPARISHNGRR